MRLLRSPYWVLLLAVAFELPLAYSSEISFSDVGSNLIGLVKLEGNIERGDLDQLFEIIYNHPKTAVSIDLESKGGDVYESLRIGRLIRYLNFSVVVHEECSSACFYIYVAGVSRLNLGRIGIHRPYFDSNYAVGLSVESMEEQYKVLTSEVRRYLLEMGVTTDFIDRSFATKSSDVGYFDSYDLKSEGIGRYTQSLEELLIAGCGELPDDEHQDWLESLRPKNKVSEGYKKYLAEKHAEITNCKSLFVIDSSVFATEFDRALLNGCRSSRLAPEAQDKCVAQMKSQILGFNKDIDPQ